MALLCPADTMLRHLRAMDAMKNFSDFRQEASMLHALQHPCIVSLIGISIHPLCFALELAPLSSLNTVLSENAKGTATLRTEASRALAQEDRPLHGLGSSRFLLSHMPNLVAKAEPWVASVTPEQVPCQLQIWGRACWESPRAHTLESDRSKFQAL